MGTRLMISLLVLLLALASCAHGTHSSAPNKKQEQQRLGAAAASHHDVHNALETIRVSRARVSEDAGIKIRLDTTVLPRSGSWITVSWEGVSDPQYDDWIAVYVPWDADVASTGPAKFKYASTAPAHMINGSGTVKFKLVNYRQDMRVALMRGGLQAPVRAAVSEVLRLANPNEPLQAHLALTSDATSMSVQWVSWNASRPAVQYGLQRDKLSVTVPAASRTYTRDQMCGSNAASIGWVDVGLLHEAVLTSLRPGERYFYRLGDPDWGWSAVRSFLAPPRPGHGHAHKTPMRPAPPSSIVAFYTRPSTSSSAPTLEEQQQEQQGGAGTALRITAGHETGAGGAAASRALRAGDREAQAAGEPFPTTREEEEEPSVRVMLVADMGQAEEDGSNAMLGAMYPSLNTTRLMAAEGDSFSLVLHAGDLAYSRGYATQWDNFMLQIEPVASTLPYMVLPGNHERDWPGTNDRFDAVVDSYGECGIVYQKRLIMPLPGWDQMWYSFEHGPLHVLMYSTEHSTAPGSPQYDFIKRDLAAVNRSVTPWVVVSGHRPLYVSTNMDVPPDGDITIALQLRQELEPLWLQYKVDLTVHGHHHTYQRTCPMANGACVGYDASGAARGPVHLIVGLAGAGLTTNFATPTPDYVERIILWWGYARMQVSRTALSVDVISDLDGGVMDKMVLRKPASTF